MPKKKKEESVVEDNKNLIVQAFREIEESDKLRDKKTDSTTIKSDIDDLLKEVIQKQLRKDYDPEVETRIISNPERGTFEVYILKLVIDEVDIPAIQISLEDVQKIDDSLELGDIYEMGPVHLDDVLTRKSIQIIKQAVQKKRRDVERVSMYEELVEKVGEVVTAEVYQVRSKEIVFTYNTTKNNKVELILPNSEKMPKDNPRRMGGRDAMGGTKSGQMKLYVKKIEREKVRIKQEDGTEIEKEREDGPMRVIVSRTDDNFLRKLLEMEVNEIGEGVVVIKGIARVPGERAKVSVESTSSRIDPVGACVGRRGDRIQKIVKELNNENIDVISFSDEPQIYVARALQPAKIDPMTVYVDFKNKKSRVMLKPEQIKYAIGKNGNNIHLAEKLTGFEIEIYRDMDKSLEDPNDIDIITFRDEFGDDMIYQLLDNGLDTAKKVLQAGVDQIEHALIMSPRREEPLDPMKRMFKPQSKIISEEERKHWHRMAESIYRTIADEFDGEIEPAEKVNTEADEKETETVSAELTIQPEATSEAKETKTEHSAE